MAYKGVILVDDIPSGGSHPVGRSATTLQPVANRPLLGHVFAALCEAGVSETVIVVPMSVYDQVRACIAREDVDGGHAQFVVHDGHDELSGALVCAARHIGEAPCVFHLADGLLWQPLAHLLDAPPEGRGEVTVMVHDGARPEERLTDRQARLLSLPAPRPSGPAVGLAGVIRFGPGELHRAARGGWFGEARLDVIAAAAGLDDVGGRLHTCPVAGWRRYAGRLADLLELNRVVLDTLSPDWQVADTGNNQIEGRVTIHHTAEVTSSTIVGPAIIGAGAHVDHAYLGPYTSIGAHARIEGTEVERSIISAGASISHVGGRLVSSVVGANARVFRDFSLPRAIRLQVGDDVEVALA